MANLSDFTGLARRVRRSPRHRQVLDQLRPRGVTGLLRTGVPVRWKLRLAFDQGRLVGCSSSAFAVLEPPTAQDRPTQPRWLLWLDRWWDVLWFVLPSLLLLTGAALLAFVVGPTAWSRWGALVLALAAAGDAAVMVSAVAVRGCIQLYRLLVMGRTADATTTGIEQVAASRWAVSLFLVPEADADAAVVDLLDAVLARVQAATAANYQPESDPPDVLLPHQAVSTDAGWVALTQDPRTRQFCEEPPVLVVRPDHTAEMTTVHPPAKIGGRALVAVPWLASGVAVVIAIAARFVADWERQECGLPPVDASLTCTAQPTTYGDALYWLMNRLLGSDPSGLGADSVASRTIGLFVSLMGVVIVGGIIGSLLRQAIERTQGFGRDIVDAYNRTVVPDAPPDNGLPEPVNDHRDRAMGRFYAGAVIGIGIGLGIGVRLRFKRRTDELP